jgi:16S rRNA (guanine527-N7)-methyltransferase
MTYDSVARATSGPGGELPPGPSPATGTDVPADLDASPAAGPVAVLPPELAEVAQTLFGDRLPLAVQYAELLATDGVVRGLLGPGEAPKIWSRHLLNCAAVAELIPPESTVLDVGSGAGLPGIVLALARPDLSVVLIEPLARRTSFLVEAVTALGLDGSVTVIRTRAEEYGAARIEAGLPLGDIVTARAVAPLDRLVGWCLPITSVGGRLLALKGSSAAEEVEEHRDVITRLGGGSPVVQRCGVGMIDPPTTVVEIVRERAVNPPGTKPSRRGGRSAARPGKNSARGQSRRR